MLNRGVTREKSVIRVVVVGTDTDVGKTWVTAQIIRELRSDGHQVAARKLVQSRDLADDPAGDDRSLLAVASGEQPSTVCPDHLIFDLPLAPPMAAEILGQEIPELRDLLDVVPWDAQTEVVFFETAGGLRSPQASDADSLDVTAWLDPHVVILVAPDVLGVISQVRLCVDALRNRLDGVPVIVALNARDKTGTEGRNGNWLRDRDEFVVLESPTAISEIAGALARQIEA